ncbi:MAG: hypothetical protein R3268_00490 [Acidiferrobacterales bacterium]|nr:hypothetical protein [Acidiferrobacterales bacterium]
MSNLLMPSRVLLYGRVVQGIAIDVDVFDAGTGGAPGLGSNRFLREQFEPSKLKKEIPCLAMIYGFEYEAHYYDLMAPTIMLVHGEGIDYSRGRRVVAATAAAAAAVNASAESVATAARAAADGAGAAEIAAAVAAIEAAKIEGANAASVAAAAAREAADTPYIGRVEKPLPDFADNVRIWPYDKADYSLRLDPCSGPIESILLEAEIDDAELSDEMAGRKVSGRKVGGYLGRGRKVSGRKVGISGRKIRGE